MLEEELPRSKHFIPHLQLGEEGTVDVKGNRQDEFNEFGVREAHAA